MFKGFLSEGGIRAPLIISGRGVDGSGRISNAVTHVMDIPATILNAAGVSHPDSYNGNEVAPLQGKSLSPILDNSRDIGSRPVGLAGLGAVRQSRHPAGQLETALALRAAWRRQLAAIRFECRSGRNE